MKPISDEQREQIARKHGMFPGRKVILKDCVDTKRRGWTSSPRKDISHLFGKEGLVTGVHHGVVEAVKVKFPTDERYWSYQDLMLVVEEPKPKIFHFDVSLLNTGV